MAFCQSTHAPQQRQLPLSSPPLPSSVQSLGQTRRQLEHSQEWVLFSPSLAESAIETGSTSTNLTPRTAGLSRLSDFGSFELAAHVQSRDTVTDEALELEDIDEGEDLDSLDSHLHAFREPSIYRLASQQEEQDPGPMLPTHDGLGTFGPSSMPVQEQLWHFEQFNQHRPSTQRQGKLSVRERLEEVDGGNIEERERIERIERWRLEQSQILLDEIQKESRRRRMSRASERNHGLLATGEEQDLKIESGRVDNGTLPIEKRSEVAPDESFEESESFWKRITRRVIRDIIGIDEPLLSIICGESLPIEGAKNDRPKIDHHLTVIDSNSAWEDRLFNRIARELGILVHQLSDHPGAFDTFVRTQQTVGYAGFPLPPIEIMLSITPTTKPSTADLLTTTNLNFLPTLQQMDASAHAALWGIEEEHANFPDAEKLKSESLETELLKREREYWEKDLDVRMIFGFLRNRFMSGSQSRTPRDTTTPSTQDKASRAALIRHHHPLISRSSEQRSLAQRKRGSSMHHRHCSSSVGSVKRPGSSCASQSAKKSAKRSGSSRHYWDLGSSVGSGSAIAASAGIGIWGEV